MQQSFDVFCLTVPPLVAAAFAAGRGIALVLRRGRGAGRRRAAPDFSRAGIPVFAVVVLGTMFACASWRLSASRIVGRALLVVCAAALVAAVWTKMEGRYAEATMQEEYFDPTIDGRGIYLRLAG